MSERVMVIALFLVGYVLPLVWCAINGRRGWKRAFSRNEQEWDGMIAVGSAPVGLFPVLNITVAIVGEVYLRRTGRKR